MEQMTNRLIHLIETGVITKTDLAAELGITRMTLDVRLKKSNWKKSELALVKKFI